MVLKIKGRTKKSWTTRIVKAAKAIVKEQSGQNEYSLDKHHLELRIAVKGLEEFNAASQRRGIEMKLEYDQLMGGFGYLISLVKDTIEKMNSYKTFTKFDYKLQQLRDMSKIDHNVLERAMRRFLRADHKVGAPTFWNFVKNEEYRAKQEKKNDPAEAALW